jgi:hypothetical protein
VLLFRPLESKKLCPGFECHQTDASAALEASEAAFDVHLEAMRRTATTVEQRRQVQTYNVWGESEPTSLWSSITKEPD